jgi:hypothetical protein
MRNAILTLAGAAAVLLATATEGLADSRVPASTNANANGTCLAKADFYADAVFSFQMQHRAAVETAISTKQSAAAFDTHRSVDATLSQTPARGLDKSWRAATVEAVYTQPQFVLLSPKQAGKAVYNACMGIKPQPY